MHTSFAALQRLALLVAVVAAAKPLSGAEKIEAQLQIAGQPWMLDATSGAVIVHATVAEHFEQPARFTNEKQNERYLLVAKIAPGIAGKLEAALYGPIAFGGRGSNDLQHPIWLNSTAGRRFDAYFERSTEQVLLRYRRVDQEHFVRRRLDLTAGSWVEPADVTVPSVREVSQLLAPGGDRYRVCGAVPRGINVYDFATDAVVTDPWLVDTAKTITRNGDFSNAHVLFSDDGSWIVAEYLSRRDQNDAGYKDPTTADFRGVTFEPLKSVLLLERGVDKPTTLPRPETNSGPLTRIWLDVGGRPVLQFRKYVGYNPETLLLETDRPAVSPPDGTFVEGRLFHDPKSTTLTCFTSQTSSPSFRSPNSFGARLAIVRWNYRRGGVERFEQKVSDLFEFRDGKLHPKAVAAKPIENASPFLR